MPAHDEICAQAIEAGKKSDCAAIVAAFVGSLTTRNLAARSAFGSYVVLQHFAAHEFQESRIFSGGYCAVCGIRKSSSHVESDERVQNYPFQVRHTRVDYSAYDLATFDRRIADAPTEADIVCLKKVLDALRNRPASAQLSELNRSLQGIIKSNKHERTILLETFGYAGILCPQDQRHYSDSYVPDEYAHSHQPQQFFKREWDYPVRFWTGADGVNEEMVARYFGRFQ